MADEFDPYYQWLSIPPKYQPPNHYRLLGVELFESNPDVISSAADQRMAHVRSFQTGKRAAASQAILNELSTARRCLLNAKSKAEYDTQLRKRQVQEAETTAGPQPGEERWAQDFAADVKAASRFATLQAERLKLTSLKLPAAYTALGNDVYADRLLKDELPGIYAQLTTASEQLLALSKQGAQSGGGLTSKMVSRVQLDTAQRRFDSLLGELGKAVYDQHAGAGASRELTVAISELETRLAELDNELSALEHSRKGRMIGPKHLALGAAAVVGLILFVVVGDVLRSVLVVAALAAAGYAGYRYFTRH